MHSNFSDCCFHNKKIGYKLNLLHMNPGAVGKHGFHKVRTMLRFKISKGEIKELEIVEFKR